MEEEAKKTAQNKQQTHKYQQLGKAAKQISWEIGKQLVGFQELLISLPLITPIPCCHLPPPLSPPPSPPQVFYH